MRKRTLALQLPVLFAGALLLSSPSVGAEVAGPDTSPAFPCQCDAECKAHGMPVCSSSGYCDWSGPGRPCDGGLPADIGAEGPSPRDQGVEQTWQDDGWGPGLDALPGPDKGVGGADSGAGADAKVKADMDCTQPGAKCVLGGETGGCAVSSGAGGAASMALAILLLLALVSLRRRSR